MGVGDGALLFLLLGEGLGRGGRDTALAVGAGDVGDKGGEGSAAGGAVFEF